MLIQRTCPEVFEHGEIETPRPGRGEGLRGSSVDPVACPIRSGTETSAKRAWSSPESGR